MMTLWMCCGEGSAPSHLSRQMIQTSIQRNDVIKQNLSPGSWQYWFGDTTEQRKYSVSWFFYRKKGGVLVEFLLNVKPCK